jgi:hypothetical protein
MRKVTKSGNESHRARVVVRVASVAVAAGVELSVKVGVQVEVERVVQMCVKKVSSVLTKNKFALGYLFCAAEGERTLPPQ